MATVRIAWFLLLLWQNAQVAAADTITLTKATRTVTGDNNDVLYTVEFQAVARPDFHWLTYYVSHPEAEKVGEMDFNNGQGTTSLLVSGTEEDVWGHRVEVGFLDTQYFQLLLPYHRSNASLTLNTVQTTVQPGLNVSYAAGSNVRVEMVAAKRIYEGASESGRGDIQVLGGYLDPDTGKVLIRYYTPDWNPHIYLDIKWRDIDEIRATLSFNNSEGNVNGWFYIVHEAVPERDEPEPVLVSLKDRLWIMVHEDTNPGPFADGFVSFTSVDEFECDPSDHRDCKMECEAHGNDIASLHIYKHGHRELGHAEETDDFASRFSASVEVSVVVDAEFDGQYDCVASDSAGREVVYPMILERPTKIHAFFNETLENGDMKMTCVASGSAPMTANITIYGTPVATIADNGLGSTEVVSHDTVTSPDGKAVTATAVLRSFTFGPGLPFIYCYAKGRTYTVGSPLSVVAEGWSR